MSKIIFELVFVMSFYDVVGISEKEWNKSIRFPTSGRKVSFYVLCGLPGTGKSTLAEKIKNSYCEGDAIILSRDVIRTNVLWDIRKEPKEIQQKTIHKLDKIVTEKMISRIGDKEKRCNFMRREFPRGIYYEKEKEKCQKYQKTIFVTIQSPRYMNLRSRRSLTK